ncbi:MAG: sialidase family protein [Burkholderiaceae bacterium]
MSAPSATVDPAPGATSAATGVTRRLPGWSGRVASAAAAVAVAWHWTAGLGPVVAVPFQPEAAARTAPAAAVESVYLERFASNNETRHMHASSAYSARPGALAAFWYGGSAEGARDVAIYSSRFDDGRWSPPRVVVERTAVQTALGRPIRKLGNATVHRHPDGRLWLLFVSVSVGGWAGSAINLIESRDDGLSWSAPRRLVTSPFLNLSTLVRTNAFRYADGSIGLPVYHEFIGKFGELLRVGGDGRILSKTRLSSGRLALQPDAVLIDAERAVLLLRNAGALPRRLLRSTTADAGRSWTDPQPVQVPNPDAALDAIALDGDRLLAVINDTETGRQRLTLAVSDDLGNHWRPLTALADVDHGSPPGADGLHEYSYPWLLRAADGTYHVLFTWNRERIRHVEFNQTWLDRLAAGR